MRFFVIGVLVALGVASTSAPAATIPAELGIGMTPAHVPRQTGVDVERMFKIAGETAGFAVILGRWDDAGFSRTVEQMTMLSDRDRLKTVVQLDIFEPGGVRLAPPAGASGRGFDRATSEAYARVVAAAAAQKPDYLIAAIDVNRLLASGTDRLAEFAQAYKQAYRAAKAVSPGTKVLVSFNYEIFRQVRDRGHVLFREVKKLVDLFRPELDAIAFSSLPSETYGEPGLVPADYFDALLELRDREDVILSTGWPSGMGGEAAQAAFIERLPMLTGQLKPVLVVWPIMHDVPGGGAAASLGLYDGDGREKAGAARFRAMREVAAPVRAGLQHAPTPVAEAPRRNPADAFRIAASTLAGATPLLLASDPKREINHARISPDGSQFVFTRYNRFNAAGEALEINGYLQSEVVVCRTDGSSCAAVLPARRGVIAANASWTPDGRQLLFVSNDTPGREAGIARLDLASREVTFLAVGTDLEFADPHQVGSKLVTPGKERSGARLSQLYLFDLATMKRRGLTRPAIPNPVEMDPPLGDHDPKLSPDGRSVAVMRHLAKDDWAIVVVDAASGVERNLSGPNPVDAVPEWSSDGKRLVFWHVDRANLAQSGLYTMRPDGTDRRRVPLPAGYFYTMPAFYPNSGSGADARIVYSARPDPRM